MARSTLDTATGDKAPNLKNRKTDFEISAQQGKFRGNSAYVSVGDVVREPHEWLALGTVIATEPDRVQIRLHEMKQPADVTKSTISAVWRNRNSIELLASANRDRAGSLKRDSAASDHLATHDIDGDKNAPSNFLANLFAEVQATALGNAPATTRPTDYRNRDAYALYVARTAPATTKKGKRK